MSNEQESFRKWLSSLSHQELIEAMKCSLQRQDYDLLSEMVRLEVPPPTPVHPRALGYRPRASQKGAQLDYQSSPGKIRRPQLFQWTERNFRGKQTIDVIARRKITPWGDVLSVGCTEEQETADMTLVDQSFLNRENLVFRGKQSTQEILRLLHVTSRGYFWQCSSKSSISFCAPWLRPTDRWFSLSFYLSSRYHVALWETFAGKKRKQPPEVMYDVTILKKAIPNAVRLGLQKALQKDSKNLNILRDSLFWGIVVDRETTNDKSCVSDEYWQATWTSLRYTKIRDHGSPASEVRALIAGELEGSFAAEMQNLLLKETQDTAENSSLSIGKTKKKKKGKKKRPPQRCSNNLMQQTSEEINDVNPDENTLANEAIRFPQNDTPSMERNRNIIIALTVLEEVVETAFLKLGLEPTPPFVPDVQNKVLAVNKQQYELKKRTKHAFSEEETVLAHNLETKVRKETTEHDGKEKHGSIPSSFQHPSTADKNETSANKGMFAQSTFNPDYAIGFAWTPVVSSTTSAFESYVPLPEPTLPRDFYQPIVSSCFSPGKASEADEVGSWPFLNRYQTREQSILSDFFRAQEKGSSYVNDDDDDDEKLMVASTTASVSSSTYRDPIVLAEAEEMATTLKDSQIDHPSVIDTIEEDLKNEDIEDEVDALPISVSSGVSDPSNSSRPKASPAGATEKDVAVGDISGHFNEQSPASSPTTTRSPSPQAPLTPPPTLSPILVSLADLRDLKRGLSLTPERVTRDNKITAARSYAAAASGSLPSSPTSAQGKYQGAGWSRDDIRIKFFRDDQNIKPKRRVPQPQRSSSELQPTYRAVAVKSLAKPIASSKVASLDFRSQVIAGSRREIPRDSCARSETAVEKHREDPQWQGDFRRADDFDNKSMTRDETTTITSALSQREPEEVAILREERNTFRDMCLTLGAEVAKLKAMLAAQQATFVDTPFEFQDPFGHPLYQASSFDPQGMQPFFYGNKRGQRLGPMSDAGVHRAGDHESQVSEDENFELMSRTRMDTVRQISSNATVVGSDASVDFNNSNSALQNGQFSSMPAYDPIPVHGLHSRLTKDIMKFVESTTAQLKKLDSKRRTAVERFTRLVTTIWPRAQVKLYGSHVSGLCLPSSDLDFVVCLPAVHKNAPALAPGVLEGRNAINESSQKLLARELKGESWIDPRSIKLIERTVVPVIKVSTKDTRAKVVQLDISFDSPEHHGLEANALVAQILEELPLIRPLMLILKQFLLDRGLLTAYTGGLSSYCLFLMVARYLQEQPRSVSDCGSLLMGFLDFYGNYFDPRATGISVRRRQFFVRPNNYRPASYPVEPPMWTAPIAPSPQHVSVPSPSSVGPHDFLRRHSFSSDTGSVDGGRRGHRPPRFQGGSATSHRYKAHKAVPPPAANNNGNTNHDNNFSHGRPFTFDPLFVEDLLSSGNNVGRNAFRIFQVQRAFSDAHRALVASLEWDIQSSGELHDGPESYPLLKCLLQSEDVLYEL